MKRLIFFLLLTAIVLSCSKNSPPVIESLYAEPDSVYPGDTVTITYKISDEDGDAILYLFGKSSGIWITDIGTGYPAKWVAPKTPGDFYLTLTISDLTDKDADSVMIHVMDTSGVFTDARDGHLYKWIRIGNQNWMVENLAYLPSVSPSNTGSITEKHYYVYGYEGGIVSEAMATANYSTYGALYNWEAAKTACPDGWHLPSDSEWTILTEFLTNEGFGFNGSGTDIGKSMASTMGWTFNSKVGRVGNDQANNNGTGFTALPGGNRYYLGGFYELGDDARFWTSSESMPMDAWFRNIRYDYDVVFRVDFFRSFGLSVRCVKDK